MFFRGRFSLCQNVKLGIYESALQVEVTCRTKEGEILWTLEHSITHMWLSPFSGQWLVAGPVNGYIGVYTYRFASVMLQSLYWVTDHFIFVCLLDSSWGCWAGKCCHYCFLFYMLEQWLLQLSNFKSLTSLFAFGFVLFYGISTIVGYLMPNPLYTYILNVYMIC